MNGSLWLRVRPRRKHEAVTAILLLAGLLLFALGWPFQPDGSVSSVGALRVLDGDVPY